VGRAIICKNTWTRTRVSVRCRMGRMPGPVLKARNARSTGDEAIEAISERARAAP